MDGVRPVLKERRKRRRRRKRGFFSIQRNNDKLLFLLTKSSKKSSHEVGRIISILHNIYIYFAQKTIGHLEAEILTKTWFCPQKSHQNSVLLEANPKWKWRNRVTKSEQVKTHPNQGWHFSYFHNAPPRDLNASCRSKELPCSVSEIINSFSWVGPSLLNLCSHFSSSSSPVLGKVLHFSRSRSTWPRRADPPRRQEVPERADSAELASPADLVGGDVRCLSCCRWSFRSFSGVPQS